MSLLFNIIKLMLRVCPVFLFSLYESKLLLNLDSKAACELLSSLRGDETPALPSDCEVLSLEGSCEPTGSDHRAHAGAFGRAVNIYTLAVCTRSFTQQPSLRRSDARRPEAGLFIWRTGARNCLNSLPVKCSASFNYWTLK